tara:strand:- start:26 stop:775 length:750 start_codon:yes stop_codon:yes gene_type:complete
MANQKLNVVALIPARLDSSRLYAKSLLPIDGLPLVVHTYKRTKLSKYFREVYICTDSKKIGEEVKKYDCQVIYTGKNKTGTDRISEASTKLKKKYSLYIDVQGDEPLLNPNHIDKVIKWHLKNNEFDIVVPTLKFNSPDNPNIVKIVKVGNKVVYFSRSKVPYPFINEPKYYLKHLSIISFKPESLLKFKKLKQSNLEKIEGIELMRALENNMKIGTFEMKGQSFSVDTSRDFYRAQKFMINDKFRKLY